MKGNWPLQDAKAHLSKLVRKVKEEGAQYISVRGEPAVVVISQEEYRTLTSPKTSIVEFFRESPLKGVDLSRDKSNNRDIDL